MKFINNNWKTSLAILMVFTMVFQIIGPIASEYSFSNMITVQGDAYEPTVQDDVYKELVVEEIRLKYKDGTEFEDGEFINVDEDLRFELDWSLPNGHEYVAGNQFEFDLPEQLTVYNPLDGNLGDYGTYAVDTNGKVIFTFNEKVEKESNIEGTFWFDTELEESIITSTEETIELVVNGKTVQKIIVNVKPKGGQAIGKDGQPVGGNFNTEEIEWTVFINTTRESLKDAIINDPILEGQELILGSIDLKEVKVDSTGNFVSEIGEATGFTNTSETHELKITLGDTNKAYKLTFKTKMIEDEENKEGSTTYENIAYLNSDGKDQAQAGGSVSVIRSKSLEKTSSVFNEGDRSIEWTVKANFNEQGLKKDDVITDEFTFTVGKDEDVEVLENVFEIKKDNIEIVQVDSFKENGEAEDTSNAKDLFDITIEGNKVTYKLKEDSNKAFVLKYKTEIKEGAYINKDGKITNKIDLNGKTSSSSQGVYQQVGKKTNAGINYEDKTIDWKITVNADKQDLRNFVLTDSFAGTGQKLVADSIKIEPADSGATITPNTDNEGFKIDFGDITEKYIITYQTKFTYDFGNIVDKPNFKNGVNVKYETSDGVEYELNFGDKVEPNKETKNNGAKNGSPNNSTKVITWKIDINYNQLELTDAKVQDAIPDNQSLFDGSVKIYETSIAKEGGITEGSDVTDEFTVDASGNKVNIDFGSISQSYRIEFKTKDKDGIYNSDEVYTNTAQFIPREGEVHNLTANVTLPNQGEFLGKTGTHNKEDWTIDWKIDVNKSLSQTSDFTVTDDLGDITAQILLEDSIKVTKVGSDVPLEEGDGKDYKLTVEGNKFEIYFPGEITEAYVITYSSYIVAEETVDVTNKAKIESNDVIKGTTDKTETVNIKISTAGGSASGETGGLTIEKSEAYSNLLLKDVTFTLEKIIGNQVIIVRQGTTDVNGKLEWKGLKYGDYTLKEIIPEGYLGKAEQTVTLSSVYPEGIKTLPIENTRKIGKVKIIKVDSVTNEKLEGAKFTIKNQTTNQEYTFTTDDEGMILEEVPYGEYTVKEIKAPNGYRVIEEDIPNITVKIDEITEIKVKNAALVDVVGQKSWVVDEAKELPSSITVKLLADGEEIDEKEINENDDWKYSFKDLDKYNEENDEIEYDIKEAGIDGYNSYNEGFNLINIQTKEVTGSKEWIGGHSVKPDIELQLFRNDASYGDPVVLKDGETSYTWTELDKTDMDGKEYKYTVDEVRVPSDYSKSISEDGLTITNRYSPPSDPIDPKPIIPEGRIRIIKRDSDSNELLKGAEFQIINSDDRIVNTLITNSQGSATSKYLPLGTYTIKEVKAPKGYKIMTEVTTNTITNGVTDEVVIYNELDKPEEPKPVDPEDTEDPEEPEEPKDPKDPDEEDNLDGNTPGGRPDIPEDPSEETDLDGNTPGGKPKVPGLPVTGSKDSILFYTIGLLSIIIGLALRKKTKHNN